MFLTQTFCHQMDHCDPAECAVCPGLDVTPKPTAQAHRDSCHLPRSSSNASACWLLPPALPSLRRGLECRPHVLAPPKPDPVCLQVHAVFGRLSSSPRRTHVAPFFRRLHTLAIEDRGTGLFMASLRFAHLVT